MAQFSPDFDDVNVNSRVPDLQDPGANASPSHPTTVENLSLATVKRLSGLQRLHFVQRVCFSPRASVNSLQATGRGYIYM